MEDSDRKRRIKYAKKKKKKKERREETSNIHTRIQL